MTLKNGDVKFNFGVTVLGIGNSHSELYYRSSFLLHAAGETVLVDCPDPIQKMFKEGYMARERKIKPESIDSVIITHAHGDHCNGLESLGFQLYNEKWFGRRLNPVNLYCLDFDAIWGRLCGSMGELLNPFTQQLECKSLEDYFNLILLVPEKEREIGYLTVQIYKTKHHGLNSFGFKASVCNQSLGYSSDTTFDPGLIEFFQDCDVIIHECNGALPGIHTGYEQLMSLPETIRKKMYLIHCPDHFDRFNSKIKVLEEGQYLEIG
ncbi:ribonuclease Z [Candidatus Woesearchaeota archaeon]|jgi:ribonuclease BN (tRNA processing enzyme)|nr:ribonuclease Z [Candidatus Woesearchaeota archaeon]